MQNVIHRHSAAQHLLAHGKGEHAAEAAAAATRATYLNVSGAPKASTSLGCPWSSLAPALCVGRTATESQASEASEGGRIVTGRALRVLREGSEGGGRVVRGGQ